MEAITEVATNQNPNQFSFERINDVNRHAARNVVHCENLIIKHVDRIAQVA